MKKQPKRKRLWLVRCIGAPFYNLVTNGNVPWLTHSEFGEERFEVSHEDGAFQTLRSAELDRECPHLKLAEGECCEIEIREVVR
jgi:hypothetical protein